MTEFFVYYGWFVLAYVPLSYLVVGLIARDARHDTPPPPRWRVGLVVALAPLSAAVVILLVVAAGLYWAADAALGGGG